MIQKAIVTACLLFLFTCTKDAILELYEAEPARDPVYVTEEGTANRDIEELVRDVWGNNARDWAVKGLDRVIEVETDETRACIAVYADAQDSMKYFITVIFDNACSFIRKFFEDERFAKFEMCALRVYMPNEYREGDSDRDKLILFTTEFPRALTKKSSYASSTSAKDFYKFLKLYQKEANYSVPWNMVDRVEKRLGR